MRRGLGYGLLALVSFAVFLLVTLPAASAVEFVSQRWPNFSAATANGTAIAGSARNVVWGNRRIGELSWRWQPSGLLAGKLQYSIHLREPEMDLRALLGVGWQRILTLRQLKGELPLPRAIELAGRAAPPLSGRLEVDLGELQLNFAGQPLAAEGTIWLRGAHTAFGRTLQLGDFRTEVSSDEATIRGAISDTGGPVQMAGQMSLVTAGDYQLRTELTVRAGPQSDLARALSEFVPPLPDGRWRFQIDGKLDW